MLRIGYKLIAEAYSPQEIVRQGVAAERAGFDFVEVSDHYHPWLYATPHSGFVWSMLGALAVRTETIELATGVTCPTMRYHPAVIAQASATTALLAEGRFTLGVGSGERLNEHVVGDRWPSITVRQEMLREAIEIIRLLWSGGYHSYDGRYLRLDDARVFDLPSEQPEIAVAAGGQRSARIAAELGDALFATEPKPGLTNAYSVAGGTGRRFAEVPLAWGPDVETAAHSAYEKFRFGLTGWKIQSELPNPINFEAATAHVTRDHLREAFGCGPDPQRHIDVARKFADAGFDQLALIDAGPDPHGFFDYFASELGPELRGTVRPRT